MSRRIVACLSTLVVLLISASTASAEFVFNITNQGAASAQMMAGVAEAAAIWSSLLADPITVNVRINAAALPAGQIGGTNAFFDPYTYANVRTALVNDILSSDDLTSTTNLQSGPAFSMLINRTANNPSGVVSAVPYFDTGLGGAGQAGPENNTTVRITSANAKALGLYPANAVGLDGTITFTTLQAFDFDRGNGIAAGQVDFVGVAMHELGHLLGFHSGVETLEGNGAAPGVNDNQLRFVTPLDLFRFSTRSTGIGGGLGVIDWTADNTEKYFSIDGGATPLTLFANGAIYGDGHSPAHWKNNLNLGLMDPTIAPGELVAISSNDLRAMDVIGFDLAVPEPATGGTLLLGGAACHMLYFGRRSARRRARSA